MKLNVDKILTLIFRVMGHSPYSTNRFWNFVLICITIVHILLSIFQIYLATNIEESSIFENAFSTYNLVAHAVLISNMMIFFL